MSHTGPMSPPPEGYVEGEDGILYKILFPGSWQGANRPMELPIVAWRAFVSTNKWFDSSKHTFADIPDNAANAIQAVKWYHAFPVFDVEQGFDTYTFPDGTVRRGAWRADAAYAQLQKHAWDDMTWPVPPGTTL